MQFYAKARVERALNHALSMHLQNTRCGKATHQSLTHFGGVGSSLAGKQQGLRHGLYVERNNDLIGHFGGLAVAIATYQRDVFTHHFKQGVHAVKRGLRTTNHDGEAGRFGTYLAARNRRIQVVAAQGINFFSERFGCQWRNRAHVHNHFACAQASGHAFIAKQDLIDLRCIWQHGDDDVAALGHLCTAHAHGCTTLHQFICDF